MNKRVVILLGVVLIGLILTTFYAFLGGFKDVSIRITSANKTYVLAGAPYEGNMRTAQLDSLFKVTRHFHESGKLQGTLGAIYYEVAPEKRKRGNVKTFVGVWLTDSSTTLPEGFSKRTVQANQWVEAELKAHFLVSPSPDEVQEQMRSYAKAKGTATENFVMEKYISDQSIILEIPIK